MAEHEVRAALVRYEVREGIGWITLNRPTVLNAISPAMLHELAQAFDRAATDAAVHAVILTGAGARAFSAGADIGFLNRASALAVRDFARLAVAVTHRIENLGKIVIAAINGYALGGGLELAEACTLRIAVPHAQLGHPEVRLGAVAGFGGTTRLPRLIGKGRALELLLTGRGIDAAEAQRLGLVNRIAAPATLYADAEALVREVLAHAPTAVRLTMEAVHRGLNLTLEESALLGADYFGLIAATEPFRDGTRAFLEKFSG